MRRLDCPNNVEHGRRQLARCLELGVKACELLPGRQFAVEKQKRGFLEARMLGQVMDRVAAIAKLAGLSVDECAGRRSK